MKLRYEQMLDSFMAADARFDGRFLAGVLSTGVYCLPSCRARKPRPENVRFFSGPDDAQEAGFRPCRRCRPDDFYRRRDPEKEAITAIVQAARELPDLYRTVDDLASALGCSTTRANELFHRHYHCSAGRFLSETRVAAACRLLLDGNERVADVALSCGYASLSAFNESFRRLTGLCPGGYRKLRDGGPFILQTPPGLRTVEVFRFHGRDPESLCERLQDGRLIKALDLGGQAAILEMTAGSNGVLCRVESRHPMDPGGMAEAHRTACRMLGFAPDPAPFEALVSRDSRLAALIQNRSGLRIPQTANVFEGVAWAIIGQQINLRFAFQLRRHLVRLAGRPFGGLFTHPTADEVAALDYDDLLPLKYSRRKAEYLIDTARLISGGALPVEAFPAMPADDVKERLEAVRGLGAWSSNYIAMRSCGFADCVPLGDTGLTSGLQRFFALSQRPGPDETLGLMEPFKPYRSFATFHLWQLMGGGA